MGSGASTAATNAGKGKGETQGADGSESTFSTQALRHIPKTLNFKIPSTPTLARSNCIHEFLTAAHIPKTLNFKIPSTPTLARSVRSNCIHAF
jgi:hypothetical protein